MAETKFNKGSEEWLMFQDFWKLCQKYWIPEEKDKYWENLIKDTDDFYKKYKEIKLSREIATAFINTQESKSKER